jgi:hypothetical protein
MPLHHVTRACHCITRRHSRAAQFSLSNALCLTSLQAVLFRSLSVLDPVRAGDIVAVSSPALQLQLQHTHTDTDTHTHTDASSPPVPPQTSSPHHQPALGILRVAAVAGDELVASDDGEVMLVPPGCVWLTCDNADGDAANRIDSRAIGPVSVYDVAGRALAVVTPGARPAALRNSSLSMTEDEEWGRYDRQRLSLRWLHVT